MSSIRQASEADVATWVVLRHALWGGDLDALTREAMDSLGQRDHVAFIATADDSHAIGFIEGSLRSSGAHVYAFIEGWYVTEAARGSGVGGALMERLEE